MKTLFCLAFSLAGATLAACGGSVPEPKEALSAAEAAARSADEVGAQKVPAATLHLKFARDQIEEAKRLMAAGDHQRAEYVLLRAKADAELALAMAKANNVKGEVEQVERDVAELKAKLGGK
jgi:hypothetical protein